MGRGPKPPPPPSLVLERAPHRADGRTAPRRGKSGRRHRGCPQCPGPRVLLAAAIVAAVASYFGASSPPLEPPRRRSSTVAGLGAVVVGATGATGRQVVMQLLASRRWERVTAVVRSAPAARELFGGAPKLTVVEAPDVGDAGAWLADTDGAFAGADVLFNCIGTTRSKAGGAAGFRHVEVALSRVAAERARRDGVPHATVVSALGANAARWVDPWEAVHPLLYQRTMGEKEAAMAGAGFASLSVFRPGMLDRLTRDRLHERLLNAAGVGLRVDVLARAMLLDAEAQAGGGEGGVTYEGNALIERWSREEVWR